jgi:hypothetical protein
MQIECISQDPLTRLVAASRSYNPAAAVGLVALHETQNLRELHLENEEGRLSIISSYCWSVFKKLFLAPRETKDSSSSSDRQQ